MGFPADHELRMQPAAFLVHILILYRFIESTWCNDALLTRKLSQHSPGLPPRLASIGVVATADAGDVAAALGLAARTVASAAPCYGYDPPEREELHDVCDRPRMATGTPAKTAVHAELPQLTQPLFRDATRDKLNEKVLAKVAQKFASKFSIRPDEEAVRPVRASRWDRLRSDLQLRTGRQDRRGRQRRLP